jgi:Protein of unknown function (DUF1036)
MRKKIFPWIVGLGLFYPCVALADANLCNHTGGDIWAAYGEQYTITDTSKDWIIGWYHIQPGQCAKPVVGDVCFWWAFVWNNCSDSVLYYADDAAGDQWGGWGANLANGTDSRFICTTNDAFYENPQYNWENPSCSLDRIWRFWGAWYYPQPNNDVTINFGSGP